jgi:hypothetical protein
LQQQFYSGFITITGTSLQLTGTGNAGSMTLLRNPNIEARNPKQILMTKISMFQT